MKIRLLERELGNWTEKKHPIVSSTLALSRV